MNAAAQHTLHVLPDIVLGYGHSDEYSFVFHKSCTLFERRAAKIASTVVSTFTAAYTYLWPRFFSTSPVEGTFFPSVTDSAIHGDNASTSAHVVRDNFRDPESAHASVTDLEINYLPTFDGRCVSYPSNQNLRDYFSWRQADCHINNLYNTTFWALVLKGRMSNTEAEQFLKGTVSSDKNEILWSRFNINYNNEKAIFRRGSVVLREYRLVEISEGNVVEERQKMVDEDERTDYEHKELSKTQKEKMKKTRQKANIVVQHSDIIKDDFWLQRPWLLSGKPGLPKENGT